MRELTQGEATRFKRRQVDGSQNYVLRHPAVALPPTVIALERALLF